MNKMIIRQLDFYTDGAYSSKTEMGGWACVCIEDDMIIDEQRGKEPYTTNNRMELMGFLCALENANTIASNNVCVNIYVDSAYIANCFKDKWYARWLKNGWRTADRQEVKNQDLWVRIVALYIKLSARIQLNIIKVKGHHENQWNSYADLLAVKARKELEI